MSLISLQKKEICIHEKDTGDAHTQRKRRVRTQGEGGLLQAKKSSLGRSHTYLHPDAGVSPSGLWDEVLLFYTHPWYFVIAALADY